MSTSSSPNPAAPVPLALITGFLGAGKTTVLRKILPLLTQRGLVPHVLINDYRNARIDAQTLEGLAATVAPINGTCVCCDSREDLMEAMKSVPLTDRSVLLLEANGSADVPELIEVLTADRRARRYTLPITITVVDAKRWQKRYWHNALEAGQASAATAVVITRTDEVSESRLAEVMEDIDRRAPRAVFSDVVALADQLADMVNHADRMPPRRFAPPVLGKFSDHADHVHAHHFASMELALPVRVHEAQLNAFLEQLPPEVIRVKGVAYLAGEAPRPILFQKVEGRERSAFIDLPTTHNYDPVAVLIGVRFSREAVALLAEQHLFSHQGQS